MYNPKKKFLSRTVPELLKILIPLAIEQEYSEKYFDQKPGKCRRCKHKVFTRYDTERRLFCIMITSKGLKKIYVYVKRYKCKKCGLVTLSEGIFYPGCLYGKPIVDLCLYLSAKNPYDRVESILMLYGIQVDGDTVKNYAKRFKNRAESMAGLEFCYEKIGINFLKLLFGVNDVKELKAKFNIHNVESVSDETYPAKKGAKKKLREENALAKQKGEKQKTHQESFGVALSYLPLLKLFVAMILTNGEFNWGEGKTLRKPTNGCDYNLTDGHKGYNCFLNRERCLVHKMRNKRKRDTIYRELKEKATPTEVYEYCHNEYLKEKARMEKKLSRKYPGFVKDGKFTGATSTNAIEGGNWRVRYELRTPYKNMESISARVLQIGLNESLKTFSWGKPIESFGSLHSSFTYSDVMNIELRKDRLEERYHYDTEAGKWYRSLDHIF